MCLGVPGIIRERWAEGGALLARGDFAGEERIIRLNYLPDLQVGEWVITHAGYALTRLTADDAAETLRTMRSVGLLPELPAPPVEACTDEVCVTCSDEGRLGEVIAPPAGEFAPARVRTEAGEEDVDVTLVGDVALGDRVLIHAGMALTLLAERE